MGFTAGALSWVPQLSSSPRGVGAMEIVAMDMKVSGMYIARQLSFTGVTFRIEEIPLDEEFKARYDKAARLVSWAPCSGRLRSDHALGTATGMWEGVRPLNVAITSNIGRKRGTQCSADVMKELRLFCLYLEVPHWQTKAASCRWRG